MASTPLCGPTNALQNFQKHAQADRTLQQDRIAGNVHKPLESFRSSPGPQAGMLDAEYNAFHAAAGPAINPFQPQPDLFQFRPAPSQQMQAPQMPDWASDFQRMHITHTPSPPPQLMAPAPVQSQNWLSGWHNDFMQEQQPVIAAPTPQLAQSTFGQSFGMFGNTGMGMQSTGLFGNSFAAPTFAQPAEQNVDMFDDAAFERAFAAASVEVAHQVAVEPVAAEPVASIEQAIPVPEESVFSQIPEQPFRMEELFPHVEQTLPEEAPVEEQYAPEPTDQDELARTAGLLLDSVRDDESQKFQESTFLALMRRIRDREVTVEGDRMVETTPSPPPMQSRPPHIAEPWMEESWEEHSKSMGT